MKKRTLLRNIAQSFSYALRYHAGLVALLSVTAVLLAIIPYATSGYLGQIINKLVAVAQGGDINLIWSSLTIYVVIRLIRPVLTSIRNYGDQVFFLRFQTRMNLIMLEKRASFDIAHYENTDFLNKLERAFHRGYWPIVNTVDRCIGNIEPIIGAIIGIVILVRFDWLAAVVLIVLTAPSFVTHFLHGKQSWGIWTENTEDSRRNSDLTGHIQRRYNVVELKMLQGVSKFIKWISSILHRYDDGQEKVERRNARNTILTELLAAAGIAIVIVMIVRAVVAGTIDIGTMTFLVSSVAAIQDTIADFFTRLARILDDNQYVTDIYELVDTKPVVKQHPNAIKLEKNAPFTITFENVSFKYDRTENYVLRKINLEIPVGTKLGVVGNNGAGKTTLIRLLCRIYDPTEGRILVNGIDLREIDIESWRRNIGVLFQDFSSYDFVANEAIAMGRPDEEVQKSRVKHAAAVSESADFIERWEHKYDQQIGVEFGGIDPSKGQKQKLALARIIYRNAPLIVLDEPTASVDAESEAKIFERIENLSKAVSAILISHRFSTVKRADKIIVIEHGSLIEEGTHDELMAKNGRYAELFNVQLEGYTK